MSASPPAEPARSAASAIATLARYTLMEAFRSRIGIAALLMVAAGMALGQFLGELAIADGPALRTLPMAWVYRVAAVFLVAGFAISSVVRDHQDKGLELLLALPLPRWVYLAGKFGGIACASLAIATAFALPLTVNAPPGGVLAWGLALALECMLMAAACLLCALSFAHLVGSLAAVAAFYVLSRSIGALIAIGHASHAPSDSAAYGFATRTLEWIGMLLPRLDLFCRGEWLIGGASAAELGSVLSQALIATTLLLAAAAVDLSRRSL
jgi:ABC-type transport system involved in multi-copper enzyme maturation permease subunit